MCSVSGTGATKRTDVQNFALRAQQFQLSAASAGGWGGGGVGGGAGEGGGGTAQPTNGAGPQQGISVLQRSVLSGDQAAHGS